MKFLFLVIVLCVGQSTFSQKSLLLFSTELCQPVDLYPLLKPMQEDPFVFQFSSQPQKTNYFTVKPVPSFNSLPSLFCKLEYKLETKSKLAPRFRLGSLQYSNWMEGQSVWHQQVSNPSSTMDFSMSDLPGGQYVLVIKWEGGSENLIIGKIN